MVCSDGFMHPDGGSAEQGLGEEAAGEGHSQCFASFLFSSPSVKFRKLVVLFALISHRPQ